MRANLKHLALLFFAAQSHVVFAATEQAPEGIQPICVSDLWTFGASALYLRPSFGGNGLGYSSFSNYGTDFLGNSVEVNGAPNHLSNVLPDYDWGFEIEAAYHFTPCNDANLNWYHLRHSTHGDLPQGTLFAGSASALYAGELSVKPEWDAINLEIGQNLELSNLLLLRLHAGVAFAKVKTTFVNTPKITPDGAGIFTTHDRISYKGFGPRMGGDFNYNVGCGFSAYANGAAGLLVGKAKQTVNGYYDLGGFNLYSTGNYDQSNSAVVVTELEGKLGLKYDYELCNGLLGLDLGYMWVTYVDSLVSQVGSGIVSSAISNSTTANFDLNGVYFRLTWTTNI